MIELEAFTKDRYIMKSILQICLQFKMYEEYILLTMMHVCKTWKLTWKLLENKFKNAPRSMKRAKLGISLRHRKKST